jgi:predicted RNA-binding protein
MITPWIAGNDNELFRLVSSGALVKYWINTVSRDHVLIGKEGSFVQAGHGKKLPLQKMSKGDLILFYSPRTALEEGELLQRFTAIAEIADEEIYSVAVPEPLRPHRRNARYFLCEEAEIKPLIPHLAFIKNKASWGFLFRFGLFEIPQQDFEYVISQMKAKLIP